MTSQSHIASFLKGTGPPLKTKTEMTQLAKALYDNAAETAEELSFRKGDIMMVVERDTAGLRGWWLCSLHGRQGIVPGNRRRDGGTGDSGARKSLHKVYTVPPTARVCPSTPAVAVGSLTQDDTYRVPRGSSEESEPCSQRHQEVYDTPSSLLADPSVAGNTYDIPACFAKKVARVTPQTAPSPPPAEEIPEDMYDVPLAFQNPPLKDDPEVYATPSNLKRAPAVHNLYEAPEDVLDAGPEERATPAARAPSTTCRPGPGGGGGTGGAALRGLPSPLLSRPPAQVHRPRLPSSESLSRRPLPALPTQLGAGETSPAATGSSPPVFVRKGSIQDRPLPPPP
ncbi:embryonal Fyn-associated substrate-like, partial [Rhinatrema bivittatum]|uniref:embryonal Fyn-associated substrate-like n=1 Tax=Rhinatrema bivittatum TaxID=194408 RepID=UPI00112646D4